MYADDTGIVFRSRDSLAKMMTNIIAACAEFGLTISEVKKETACLRTNSMDRVIFVIEIAGQVYELPPKYVYLGASVCEGGDLTIGIDRRVLLAGLCLRRYGLPLCHQSTVPLRLKLRMLNAKLLEKKRFPGGVTWSPNTIHLVEVHQAYYRFFLGCIGWEGKRCND